MPEPEDVQDSSTTSTEPEPELADPAVTGVEPQEPDRPWRNLKAEFDRKHGELQQGLATIMAILQASQTKPEAPQSGYTSEQLAQLAAAGHPDALTGLVDQRVNQTVQTRMEEHQRQQASVAEWSTLRTRYPQFADPSHPLTQYAMQVKSVLLRGGKPNAHATDVEAMLRAIADNPALVQPRLAQPVGDATRQTGVQAQGNVTGATQRRAPAAKPAIKLDPKAYEIAKRMGVKDPQKAIEKFWKNQKDGRSSVSPTIGMIIRDQENG